MKSSLEKPWHPGSSECLLYRIQLGYIQPNKEMGLLLRDKQGSGVCGVQLHQGNSFSLSQQGNHLCALNIWWEFSAHTIKTSTWSSEEDFTIPLSLRLWGLPWCPYPSVAKNLWIRQLGLLLVTWFLLLALFWRVYPWSYFKTWFYNNTLSITWELMGHFLGKVSFAKMKSTVIA